MFFKRTKRNEKFFRKNSLFFLRGFLFLFPFFFLASCSFQESKSKSDSNESYLFGREFIDLPLSANFDEGLVSGLNLTTIATNVYVSVSGCASGYTLSATEISGGSIKLIKGDLNCLVKLEQFTVSGNTYQSTGVNTVPFTTWLMEDTATFQDSVTPTELNDVKVLSQVTQAGVQVSDEVRYNFGIGSFLEGTGDAIDESLISTSSTLTVQGNVPNFEITETRFVTINANGSASLEFTLECGGLMTGSSIPTYACDDVLLQTEVDYILIPDAYSQGAITTDQANDAFQANTPTAVGSLIVAPGGNDLDGNTLTNGGFYTSNASPLVTGTTPIIPDNYQYVFMVRIKDLSGNTKGYVYFYITLPDSVTDVVACGVTFDYGTGTIGDPYQIGSRESLENIGSCTSNAHYFILTASLDLGGSGDPWTPIDLYGHLDGNGHTISNLYFNNGTLQDQGLFNNINSGASVTDLTISAADVTASGNTGILAGNMEGGTITNVSANGTLTLNQAASNNGMDGGGLIGVVKGGTLSQISSSATVTLNPSDTANYSPNIGGLIGRIDSVSSTVSLSSCSNTGNILIESGNVYGGRLQIGGLLGQLNSSSFEITLSHCYSIGNLTQNSISAPTLTGMDVGAFIGKVSGSQLLTIQRSFSSGDATVVGTSNTRIHAAGFLGRISSTNANVYDNYSSGSVVHTKTSGGTTTGIVGGFVGDDASGTTNYLRNYSSAETVSADVQSSWLHGFIGLNQGASIYTNNYFYDGPNVPSNQISSGVTALTTTAALAIQGNYTGFDFSTPIWRMPSANPLSPNGYLSPVHDWLCGTNGVTCP